VILRERLLHDTVKAAALTLGFDRVAIGPADPPEHAEAFRRWLEAGQHGTMEYLQRSRDDRVDPQRLLPGCRSVVAVALAYASDDEDGDWGPVARYARGRDYHDVMRPRLAALARVIEEAGGGEARTRVAVDTSAVLERDLAARAGLGWIGKNTNVLAPGLGSCFFIGIVLTTVAMTEDARVADHCGTCQACLDACPTDAFVAPYVLDARRCISYLTIEHRGHVDESLRPALGDWVFGCDICQDVCPWARKARVARDPAFAPTEPLGPLTALLVLDDAEFRRRFRHTAIWRTRREGLVRNVALSLGARSEASAREALERALSDASAHVREAAAWALARL